MHTIDNVILVIMAIWIVGLFIFGKRSTRANITRLIVVPLTVLVVAMLALIAVVSVH